MADLICRWRNGTPKNVMEVVNSMPHHEMPEWQFKDYMLKSVWGNSFSRTVYQFASQLALYYISDDGVYHPRFDHDINELEAKNYMERWLPRYYIPNPYVSSDGFNNIDCPTLFLKSLYDYAIGHPDCSYAEAYHACFQETAKNNDDIIRNYINSYAKVLVFQKDGKLTVTDVNPQNVFGNMDRNDRKAFFDSFDLNTIVSHVKIDNAYYRPYLTAIRTKPFLLLAGISGTGKSRIVRELAFKSCPRYLQDKDGTTPGNYCMIEVKPNWHDSTELLGYYSRLGKAGYQFKKFVKFLVKAKMFPKVPFFVCMDEMNLAPVEHYFAEILSIIETRKHPKTQGSDGINKEVIKTDPIIEARYFRELEQLSNTKNVQTGQAYATSLTDRDIYMKLFGIDTESDIDPEIGQRTDLTTEGLTLPDNVIIIGTVNMDDTTHQFSRKVIDRAMTIEMNGGKLSEMYGGSKNLEYLGEEEQQKWQGAFRQRYVTADEVLEAHANEAKDIMEKVPARLEEINKALKGTPFEVSYRVLNELTIMIGVMLDSPEEGDDINSIIDKAIDRTLLMKILPRIEGDSDMFNLSQDFQRKQDVKYNNRLEWLKELAPAIVDESDERYPQTARGKIQEMIDRLENQEFTRFWP